MFVVSSTVHGISQRLLAFEQITDAMAQVAAAMAADSGKSQIYKVASEADTGAAVSEFGMGKGVLVDAISQIIATNQIPQPAKAPTPDALAEARYASES